MTLLKSFVRGIPLQSNITPAKDTAWSRIGNEPQLVRNEIEKLYWEGVKGELENIIRTLKAWQAPEYNEELAQEDEDEPLHGYDTFVDQVSQESRAFAIRYGNDRYAQNVAPKSYKDAIRDAALDRKAQQTSAKIKASVRQKINELPKLRGREQTAWTLLQAAGFLDIEKLVEHRPPLSKLDFWKRPAIPQLCLAELDHLSLPRFRPMHCQRLECNNIIRGSMFKCTKGEHPGVICEDCYHTHYYGSEFYVKAYKHCALHDSITSNLSRKICRCKGVPHYDESGIPQTLFPVDKSAHHVDVGGFGTIQCGLLKMGEMIARAKCKGLQEIVSLKATKQSRAIHKDLLDAKAELITLKDRRNGPESLKVVTGSSLQDQLKNVAAASTTSVVSEAEADRDIPLFFRRFAKKYPFGDVHMALRVGPILIENGVAHTQAGALITIREAPAFHDRFALVSPRDHALALSGSSDRTLWEQKRPVDPHPKRYKAVMKQIVGSPFTGLLPQHQELEIVRDILAASKEQFDNPGIPSSDQRAIIDACLGPILAKLKSLVQSRVTVYLDSIVSRLLSADTTLTWSATKNNCQDFCNSLLDPAMFEPLVSPDSLYLMSFLCPDSGYLQPHPRSKYDVPSGLTEEYLLRFHFGRHDEADVIDALQEYWYDWGAFRGGPLYRFQPVFSWDCTEAFGRYPTKCGSECNLAKHVWAFPFDSWSVAAHHLTRDKHMYAPDPFSPGSSREGFHFRSRLMALRASGVLSRAAVAMALTPRFHAVTRWLSPHSSFSSSSQQSRQGFSLRAMFPSLTRVKLGGIHRAQPFSHYFDAGTYRHYFVAEWALLSREEQVAAYEVLRDGRKRMRDLPIRDKGRFDDGPRGGRDGGLFGWDKLGLWLGFGSVAGGLEWFGGEEQAEVREKDQEGGFWMEVTDSGITDGDFAAGGKSVTLGGTNCGTCSGETTACAATGGDFGDGGCSGCGAD